ncbi:unnamed protein product [Symbiodinium sp. CCMP2592]|nr:unnamed protein product [Symbiodinium sp. CCMP2592]
MPPKKKAGAKAKVSAKASSSAADANQGEEVTATLPENLNLEHDAAVNRAIENILGCPAFADILTAAPIGISTTDVDAFEQKKYDAAFFRHGKYAAAGNLFWLNLRWSPAKSVPTNRNGVKMLQARIKRERSFDYNLVVAVAPDGALELGNLRRISAQEYDEALLLLVSEVIDAAPDVSELLSLGCIGDLASLTSAACGVVSDWYVTARFWRKIVLSVTLCFEQHASPMDAFIRSAIVNLRNDIADEFEAVLRSGPQRIMELMLFRKRLEAAKGGGKITNEQVYEAWIRQIPNRESKVLEKVSLDFVCAAQKIYTRLLQDSDLRSLVFQLEESWGKASPFCQLGTLEKVVVKATPIGWTLRTVKFMLETQIAFPRDFNASTLDPPRGKGLITLFNFKHELLQHLLTSFLESLPMPFDDKKEIRDRCSSHQLFLDNSRPENMQWQSTVSEAARKVIAFLKADVYGVTNDGHYKTSLRGTIVFKDLLTQCSHLADSLDEIQTLHGQQRDGGSGSGRPAPDWFRIAWREHIQTTTDQFVKLIPDTSSSYTELAAALGNTVVKSCRPYDANLPPTAPSQGSVMLYMDTKTMGEASALPHCRLPPFQKSWVTKFLHGFVKARFEGVGEDPSQEGELIRGDIVAILDGGREGLSSQIASVFTNYAATTGSNMMTKARNPFYVVYSLEGIQDSRERIRGICNQMESMSIYTLDGLWLPKRKRIVLDGANNGNVFNPVAGLGLDHKDTWLLSPADRKKVYTSSAKILVGGTVPDAPAKPVCNAGEPVSWHLTHPSLYLEVLNAFNVKVMVQAYAMDHLMALKRLVCTLRRPGVRHSFTASVAASQVRRASHPFRGNRLEWGSPGASEGQD